MRWSARLAALWPPEASISPRQRSMLTLSAQHCLRCDAIHNSANHPFDRNWRARFIRHSSMPSMDYNPRMSMAPRGSQQSSQQKPKRDDDEDAFMKLVRAKRQQDETTRDRVLTTLSERSRNRRLHQRHWNQLLRRRPAQTQPTADPKSLRMVRGTAHKHNARGRGACHAIGSRRSLR